MITAGPLSTTDLAATVRASIHGDVVTPDEPSFAAAAFGATGVAPELVVVAADAADVGRTVVLAGRHGRRVIAQVTGRPTRIAAERTILVVTRLLAAVRVDADRRTATVGIGASWRQVLDAAEPFGLTALSATARRGPQSAGLGPRGTVFAFAADRIRSFEVVTATGERLLVGPDSPDFRALRQGQTAAGLIVAMTLELVRHPALTVAELTFAADDAADVLAGWRRWSGRLPETAITDLADDPAGGVRIRLAHVGDPAGVPDLLDSLRVAVRACAITESVGPATVAAVAGHRTGVDRAALAA